MGGTWGPNNASSTATHYFGVTEQVLCHSGPWGCRQSRTQFPGISHHTSGLGILGRCVTVYVDLRNHHSLGHNGAS